ncbi:MAG: TonB-dependent receptor [Bacteroidota bacterium]
MQSAKLSIFLLWSVLQLSFQFSAAQNISVSGRVVDETTGTPLTGVNISVKNATAGTITNEKGEFLFSSNTGLPFTLIFSYVGYEHHVVPVPRSVDHLLISLKEEVLLGKEVVIAASRVEENILRSPVTIEKIGIIEIRQSSAANFYDGLATLKGVDMTVHGLTFRVPNTRGFNGNTSVRMNQLVDGMDNAPPGLNFAAGNIFGLNQLDVESVELLVGASSALYGPGGMNGTLIMTSKNPFDYQGLSASAQMGMMHVNSDYRSSPAPMGDFNIRYAKAFNSRLGLKLSVGYLQAEDWHASDFRDRNDVSNDALNRKSNPGYDGVNVYGDDIVVPVNLKDVAPAVAEGVAVGLGYAVGSPEYTALYNQVISLLPDQIISRTGWDEKHLVDYNTSNLRMNTALHYRIHEKLELIVQAGYGKGTSVYTTNNRFSLRNFEIASGKLELKNSDFYVRSYGLAEFSGNSYDAGATALLMNEKWKPSELWYQDYIANYTQQVLLGNTSTSAHSFARLVADNRDEFGNQFNPNSPALPLPGSTEFKTLFDEITQTPVNQGGSKVIDRSKLWHTEGMYDFSSKIKFAEIVVGASHRLYSINSQGTIFIDKPGAPILINQVGAFTQISKKIVNEKVKLVGSARFDKNEYFKGRITPRFSVVYSIDHDTDRNIRASLQTAFRFPTIADQWVDLNTGRYRVLGGQPQVQNLYQFDTSPVYPLSGTNPISDVPVTDNGPFVIPVFGPERVTAIEVGYKGLHLDKKLLVDGYVYRNVYNGFLATQVLAQFPNTPEEKRYETTISTDFPITTYGWALGADVMLPRGFLLRSNVNYNSFQLEGQPPTGFQSSFNTPRYRYNLSIGNHAIFRNMGFNINWRWQQKFLWESNFGVADIPAFATLDASISIPMQKMKSTLKIGGSNLTNHYYTTNLGSAQIGGLYYVTWILNDLQK